MFWSQCARVYQGNHTSPELDCYQASVHLCDAYSWNFGDQTETDIVNALEVEGFSIEKKQISLEKPIEELGIFDVNIKLHSEVTAKIRLWVTKK